MKCHELSDFTERWDLSSCTAANGRRSLAFEQVRATSTSSTNLPNDAGPGGVGSSSTSAMLTHFTDARSRRVTSRRLCPAMPNGVSASSTWLTPTATNSVSLDLCLRLPSSSGSKPPAFQQSPQEGIVPTDGHRPDVRFGSGYGAVSRAKIKGWQRTVAP